MLRIGRALFCLDATSKRQQRSLPVTDEPLYSAQLRELCLELGATQGQIDDIAATYRLAPGPSAPLSTCLLSIVVTIARLIAATSGVADYQANLLRLPSAQSLHAALQSKLDAEFYTDQLAALETAMRTQGAQELVIGPTLSAAPHISCYCCNASSTAPPATTLPPAPHAPLTPRLVRTIAWRSSSIANIAMCASGKCIVSSGGSNKTAVVRHLPTGRAVSAFSGHSRAVLCVALFSDGVRAVSSGNDSTVCVWRLDTQAQEQAFTGHTKSIYGLAVSPDDCTVASASADRTIKLWNVRSRQHDATLVGHRAEVWCVAFSADGQTLASGSANQTIKLWSVPSRSLVRTITGHSATVRAVALHGERLVSGSWDTTIKVWKWRTGELERTLAAHTNWVTCIAVFPDGERIASGSMDQTIAIWNVRSGRLECTLRGHKSFVKAVAVSREGDTLVSSSWDNKVRVWALRGGGRRMRLKEIGGALGGALGGVLGGALGGVLGGTLGGALVGIAALKVMAGSGARKSTVADCRQPTDRLSGVGGAQEKGR